MAGILLGAGADAERPNEKGETPLFFADPAVARKYGIHQGLVKSPKTRVRRK